MPVSLIFVIFIAGVIIIILNNALSDFRSKLKPGDIVGVSFGNYTLNRKILSISDGKVQVKNFNGFNSISVSIDNVYIPDKWTTIEEVIDEDD